MHCKHSPYFQVTYFSKVSTKVAAGMSVNFQIKFTPMKLSDYCHVINFETDGESFDVPIMGECIWTQCKCRHYVAGFD